MKVSQYTSSFLTADDVKKPRLLYVTSVTEEKVGTDNKLVLRADDESNGGDEIKIALNKTNIDRLTTLFKSDESDDWIGLPVVAYRDANVMFNNRKVGGIAFRLPKEGSAKPRTRVQPEGSSNGEGFDPSADDDIPF